MWVTYCLMREGRYRGGGQCFIIQFSSHWFRGKAGRFECILAELVYSTPRRHQRLADLGGYSQSRMAEGQEVISFRLVSGTSGRAPVYQLSSRTVLTRALRHCSTLHPAIPGDNPRPVVWVTQKHPVTEAKISGTNRDSGALNGRCPARGQVGTRWKLGIP